MSCLPDCQILEVCTLSGGISTAMTRVTIKSANGSIRKIVVRQPSERAIKRNPEVIRNEYRILAAARNLKLPVPEPLFAGDTFLIVSYCEGFADFNPDNVALFAETFAEGLVGIHSADASSISDLVPSQITRLEKMLSTPPDIPDATLQEKKIREQLSTGLSRIGRNKSVLLHGDYWPGNVLWNDGKIASVIDWEEPGFGDPLLDLAVSRLDILWMLGEDAMEAFTAHYQKKKDLNYSGLPVCDLWAALRPCGYLQVWSSGWAGLGRPDVTLELMAKRHQFFTEQAFRKLI